MNQWSPIQYETLKWENKDDLIYLSRASRKKILPTYESSLPFTISDKNIFLPAELNSSLGDLRVNISRFDMLQSQKGYSFPTILLRSESAASSQIENLTSSIPNISLAQLSSKAPQNAQLIAGNILAMRKALDNNEPFSINSILEIHKMLMSTAQVEVGGVIRSEPVWIGGTNYSPHGALFVPPHHSRLEFYMNDLINFSERIDVDPIVKAAIIHAQFETIHPFIDGNGRTGRTLIHKILKNDNVLLTVALPLSAGLLNKTDEYMSAFLSFQEGNPIPIIEQVFYSLELALIIGEQASADVSEVVKRWKSNIDEKRTSSIWKLIYLLIDQPVVNSTFVSENLNITLRAANQLISRAINYGILRRIGNEQRGIFYQADDIISILDKISDNTIIRREFT